MSQRWEFVEEPVGEWRWRLYQPDGSRNISCRTFRSGVDCVVHAMRHGYLQGTPMAEALRQRNAAT
jgi:hypothetical protein